MALHPGVDHRELLVDDVVNDPLFGLAGAQVEAPLKEHEVMLQVGQHLGEALHVDLAAHVGGQPKWSTGHHDLGAALAVVLFPGIGHVVHIGWVGLEPADLVRRAMARHHAKARGQRVVKLELVPTGGKGVHVVEQRQVVQDGVVGRDRHVVRQAWPGQLHWHEGLELTQPVHHAIVHVGRFLAIGKKQELAGAFIDPRVGRDRQARQPRVDRQPTDGGQVAGAALVDRATQVPHRHQVPGVVLDVGVGGVLDRHVGPVLARRVLDALPQCRAGGELFLQAVGHDPAVLVLRFAIGEAHCVQHAIAVKPVVTAGCLETAVRAVAHVHAGQVFRDFTFDVGQVDR